MRKLICLIALLSTCGFGYQAYQSHTFASFLAFIGSLLALLTALANLKGDNKKSASVNQSINNNSSGIQIGGNLTINNKDKK